MLQCSAFLRPGRDRDSVLCEPETSAFKYDVRLRRLDGRGTRFVKACGYAPEREKKRPGEIMMEPEIQ